MPGESINNTTMWTPNRGFDQGWASGGQTTAFGANKDPNNAGVMDPYGLMPKPSTPAPPVPGSGVDPSQGAAPNGAPVPNASAPPVEDPMANNNFSSEDPMAGNKMAANGLRNGFGVNYRFGNNGWQPGSPVQGATDTPAGPMNNAVSIARREQAYKAAGIPTDGNGNALPQAAAASNPAGNSATPASNAVKNNPYSPQWQTGVTSSSIDPVTGQMRYDPTNPQQFATQGGAADLAKKYGLNQWGLNLQGPGMGFSQDMQMLGNGLNAGLMQGNLSRYGTDPTGYGEFLNQRDIKGSQGQGFTDNFGQWATSQPGFKMNPLLANSGAGYNMVSDGKGGFTNQVTGQAANEGDLRGFINQNAKQQQLQSQQLMQQQAQQASVAQPGQQPGNPFLGNDSREGPFDNSGSTMRGIGDTMMPSQYQSDPGLSYRGLLQQASGGQNQSQNLFAQLGPILNLLQSLGLGGGGNQGYQRPPAFPQGGNLYNYPYYSRFA